MDDKHKCSDHALWSRHLYWACCVSMGSVLHFIFIAHSFSSALFMLAVSMVIFMVRLRINRKHYEWHLEQDEGEHTM